MNLCKTSILQFKTLYGVEWQSVPIMTLIPIFLTVPTGAVFLDLLVKNSRFVHYGGIPFRLTCACPVWKEKWEKLGNNP